MAPKTDHLMSLRAARQLRRVRGFYAAGVLLWAGAAVWSGRLQQGSRQMWVAVLLAVVFTCLLGATCHWLRRLRAATAGERPPAHHAFPAHRAASAQAAPRRTAAAPRRAGV
ncbi:hypothetical protein [Streptomyces roseolus]|uniref:hypothetical protein n=1 Tax=Streptomyces roseolus TaxID=67358 RepID=UPI00379E14CC